MAKKNKYLQVNRVKKNSVAMKNNSITVKNVEEEANTQAEIVVQNKIDFVPKVSVIIPVYNVEKYIGECLDSVINQTLKEIEIICVDDGSTDNSLNILKEYAKKDSRITVLKQKNCYAGVARNAGLSVAKGEWVHFLDSDDWIETEGFENIYNILIKTRVDFIKFKNNTYDNVLKKYIKDQYTEIGCIDEQLFDKILIAEHKVNTFKMPDSPWSGIYNRQFLNKHNIKFDNLKCANDSSFFFKCLVASSTFYIASERLVNYRVNNNKSLVGIRSKNFDCQINQFYRIEKYIQDCSEELKKNIRIHLLRLIMILYNKYIQSELDAFYKQKLFKEVSDFLLDININWFYENNDLLKFYNRIIKQKKSKISVIIPVFNASEYLKQCLDSVLSQTLKDIEVICVNDGSTDDSIQILNTYFQNDDRIVLINRENKGVAFSRNEALDRAHGEFVIFLDSDDYYPNKNVLKSLYDNAVKNNALICGGNLLMYNNGKKWVSTDKKQVFCNNEFIKYQNYQYDYGFTRYIFNTKFLKDHNIKFPLYTYYEDPVFFVNAMVNAKEFYTINNDVYVYRFGEKVRTYTEEKVYHLLLGLKDVLEICVKNQLDKLYDTTLLRIKSEYKKIIAEFESDRIKSVKQEIMDLCLSNVKNRYKNDKTKAKVSIVLPIYNAEPYLKECLDSCINQTLKDIEIICVNDGSTDNSLNIVKEYAKKDKRIKYIDKPNAGYGQTMNCGMALASGEYVGIVEPDDFIKPDMYETLYKKAKELDLDIIKSDYYQFEEKNGKYEYKQMPVFGDKTYYDRVLSPEKDIKMLYAFSINPAGIFRTSFLNKYDIKHNETPGAAYQDNGFWVQTMYLAKRIYFMDKPFYCYRQDNPNQSIKKKNNVWTIPVEYEFIDKVFEKHAELKTLKPIYVYRKYLAWLFHMLQRLDEEYWPEYLDRMSKEFKQHQNKNEIDKKYYSQKQLSDLNLIINDYQTYIKNNRSNTKISIIVPVYNTAKYLAQCLDGCLKQTLKEIEIICIDDGSTDNSLQILKEYAQKDKRITVLTQSNQKQGAARNKALMQAKGEYVLFVDSDDYIHEDTCAKLYMQAHSKQLDMVLFSGWNVDSETKQLKENNYWSFAYCPKELDKSKFSFEQCKNFIHKMPVSACLTMYNHQFLKDKGIRFPERVYFEDNLFFVKAVTQMKYIGICDEKLYFRTVHQSSTTQNWTKNFNDYLFIVEEVLSFLKQQNIQQSIFDNYKNMYLSAVKNIYGGFRLEDKKKLQKNVGKFCKKHHIPFEYNQPSYFKAYALFPLYLYKLSKAKKKLYKLTCQQIWHQLIKNNVNLFGLNKGSLSGLILKYNPQSEYVKNNLKQLTNTLYDKTKCRKKHRFLGIKFYTHNKHKELMSIMQYTLARVNYTESQIQILKTSIANNANQINIIQKTSTNVGVQLDTGLKELRGLTNEISQLKYDCACLKQNDMNAQEILSNTKEDIAFVRKTIMTTKGDVANVHKTVLKTKESVSMVQQTALATKEDIATVQQTALATKEDIAMVQQTALATKEDVINAHQTTVNMTKTVDTIKDSALNTQKIVGNMNYQSQRNFQELNYADLLHDTICESPWLKNKTLSLFGWAANYSFIYLLYRVLDKVMPQNILEMGLGQTTKLTAQYVAHKNPSARLNVCEHNQDWINIYQTELPQSENMIINHFDLSFFEYEGKQNDKYKDLTQKFESEKFDLIIVDGPVGGGKNLPRSNILDLIQNDNLANDFIIIFDDSERVGEKNTIAGVRDLLKQKGIDFVEFDRNGIKNQYVITSPSRSFVQFL